MEDFLIRKKNMRKLKNNRNKKKWNSSEGCFTIKNNALRSIKPIEFLLIYYQSTDKKKKQITPQHAGILSTTNKPWSKNKQ